MAIKTIPTTYLTVPQHIGWYWFIPFGAWYGVLYLYQTTLRAYIKITHVLSLFFALILALYYINDALLQLSLRMPLGSAWLWCNFAFIPAMALLFIHVNLYRLKRIYAASLVCYRDTITALIIGALAIWLIGVNIASPGVATPLPYLPLLNPMDITAIFVLITIGLRLFHNRFPVLTWAKSQPLQAGTLWVSLLFVWSNMAILRILHFYYDVPFDLASFYHSQLTQAVLSLFWGIIALTTTISGYYQGWRYLWFIGSTMIAITVVKLLWIDLTNAETVERITAFVSIGIILLIIGYFAPLPPRSDKA